MAEISFLEPLRTVFIEQIQYFLIYLTWYIKKIRYGLVNGIIYIVLGFQSHP